MKSRNKISLSPRDRKGFAITFNNRAISRIRLSLLNRRPANLGHSTDDAVELRAYITAERAMLSSERNMKPHTKTITKLANDNFRITARKNNFYVIMPRIYVYSVFKAKSALLL